VVRIVAAPEPVSAVRTGDALRFARACYHHGNRHVALQIEQGELRYLADHVLDEMVRGLGLAVEHTERPFEPESGAYSGHGHGP
jgi:urease accessory protein